MRELSRVIGYALFFFGVLSLAISTIYEHFILAFIGLGLTFWGALLLYVRPQRYVKENLLKLTTLPALAEIDRMLTELGYQGKGTYLPPKYLKNLETTKVLILKSKSASLPKPEEIRQKEDRIFIENPEGVLLIPPGLYLSRLFEEKLKKRFTDVDLELLQRNLPKIFVEDLEIAEDLEIEKGKINKEMTKSTSESEAEYETIRVKITNSPYQDLCKNAKELSLIHNKMGCPICSAVACALAKTTGKPVIIEKSEISQDGRIIETQYRIVEE